MKCCSRCRQQKDLSDFNRRSGRCKPCQVLYVAEWRKANPQKRANYDARYRELHREELRVKNLAYYHARMTTAPDAVRANRRAAAKTSTGVLANRAARHARRGAPLDAEAKDYLTVIANDPCVYCGGCSKEMEHIVPVATGGTSEWNNLAPVCRRCNARKGDKTLLTFLLERSA